MNGPELMLVGVASPRRSVGCGWFSDAAYKLRVSLFLQRKVFSAGHLGEMTLPVPFSSVMGRSGM